MWSTITTNSETARKEILIDLLPNHRKHMGKAAIRIGDWKLITGHSICPTCVNGWVHLDGSIDLPSYTPSLTWLFNITADPNERNNVADMYPEVVKQLKERIEYYNSTHIWPNLLLIPTVILVTLEVCGLLGWTDAIVSVAVY